MLKPILVSTAFLALTAGLIFQFIYIEQQRQRYRELQIEFGHARAIDAYQRVLEQVHEQGPAYAQRALTIGRIYETVKLEEWAKKNEIKLTEHTEVLLSRVDKFKEENRVTD